MVFVLGMLIYREHLDGNSNSAVLIAVLAYLMHPVGVAWMSNAKRRK
jgi:multisubunit Na+/H+ antiporter MnhG subunit